MKSRNFGKALLYAFQGLRYAFSHECNLRKHFFAAAAAFFLAYWYRLDLMEWMILLLTVAVVLAAELLNTAIEKAVDLITAEFHPLAKIAKDTAAGAVLIVSIAAAIIGYLLFFDKIFG